MPMDCTEARENIDAWALGALDSDDARLFKDHLSSCPDCILLADEARHTGASLALAVPLRSANAALKARVLASAAVLEPAAWDGQRNLSGRRPASRYMPTVLAAGLALCVALAGWGIYAQNQMNNLRDDNARVSAGATTESAKFATASTQLVQMSALRSQSLLSQDAITDIVSQPDATRLQLIGTSAAPDSTGRYVWSREARMGALVALGLPALADDQTYCLWLVYENDWVLGGLFDVDIEGNGRLIVRDLQVDTSAVGALRSFAVSVEPAGDVTQHTGETVLQASVN
jgi:hypothetical protein